MFTIPTDAKTYALAGHATITLTSQRTGARYTYKINQAKDRETGEAKPLWFVALLTGPDNEADYRERPGPVPCALHLQRRRGRAND